MDEKKQKYFELEVKEDSVGKRLDVFLSEMLPDYSRSSVKRLFEKKLIQSPHDLKLKPSLIVEEGMHFSITLPEPETIDLVPEDIHLDVLYEDADIIVLNKHAGIVVHPAKGNAKGTLVNALLAHCKDLSGIGGELKPGIVHRLDKGTSGVMVAAKNDLAHQSLATQFSSRTLSKTYLAFVYGKPKETGKFSQAIGRSQRDRKKYSQHTLKPKEALTTWKVLEQFSCGVTLVEVALHTGRTHQIRVHFSEAGFPLVGDSTYGGEKQINRIQLKHLKLSLSKLQRPALHSFKMNFSHPRTHDELSFEAPMPNDLKELLDVLRKSE